MSNLTVRYPVPKGIRRLLGAIAVLGGLAWDVIDRRRTARIMEESRATEDYAPAGGWS